MPELVTPEGTPVKAEIPTSPNGQPVDREAVDREFSRAMASEDPGSVQPPPPRDDQSQAEPPKRPRGRPRKDEKSRTEQPPQLPQKVDTDYTEAVAGLTTLAWATLAGIPYTTPYAAVIDANQVQLIDALNKAAQNNAAIREQIEKLAAGGGGVWAIQLAAVGANMTIQTLQLVRDPELRKEAAAVTQKKFRAFLSAQGIQLPDEQPQEAAHAPAAA